MKIGEIKNILLETPLHELEAVIGEFALDERTGVQKLCIQYRKKIDDHNKLMEEWALKEAFDDVFKEANQLLVGIDEVGRGPLAGPVVACAVILPKDCSLLGVKDSKKLTEEKRESLYNQIRETALAVGIGIVEPAVIDEINILQATFLAMRKALEDLGSEYGVILVDGDKMIPKVFCTQHAIIGGDNKSAAIAAASVVAKVTRDRMMREYAETYPVYDWESNKGYGSSKHYEGIRAYGITPLHRKSFLKNEGI